MFINVTADSIKRFVAYNVLYLAGVLGCHLVRYSKHLKKSAELSMAVVYLLGNVPSRLGQRKISVFISHNVSALLQYA